ncbi:AAA domain-containing protein [Saccharothrix isguenensis]
MDWKQDLLGALDEMAKLPGDSAGTEWKCLGRVLPTGEPGWYSLDLRSGRNSRGFGSADSFDQLCLADKEGPERGTHIPIERSLYADGVMTLKVSGPVPRGSELAWTIRLTPQHLLKRLREGVAQIDEAPLAAKLAAGRLDPVPADTSDHPPGFMPGQRAAYRACLTPGLHAVWGPPGTGKTTVLSRAIEDLVKAGKRVLLVSTANIAVDNAMSQVVRKLNPRPGQVIRVGPPHLPELAADDDIQLHRLAARTTAETDAELADVQERLAQMDSVEQQLSELDANLADYDHDAYVAAVRRIDNTRRCEVVRGQLGATREELVQADNAVSAARAAEVFAAGEAERVRPQREALADAHRYRSEATRLRLESQVREAEVRRLGSTPPPRGFFKRKRALRELEQRIADHGTYARQVAEQVRHLEALVAHRERDAGQVTADFLDQLDRNLDLARARLAGAERVGAEVRRRVRALEADATSLSTAGLATDEDQDFVQRADRGGLPESHVRRLRLRDLRDQGAAERGRLEDRLRKLNAKITKLRRDAEGEIVGAAKVVGTTLARSRAHRAVAEQVFDVVIVDEAGAAVLGEVILAVARARVTAVLLGDFLQLPPVVRREVQEHAKASVRRWMAPDSFEHCKIRTPEDAHRNPGCVVLTDQFRFGPNLQRLANDVLYRVLEDGRHKVSNRPAPDTTLVLVDVGQVGELNTVHRSTAVAGWWAVGALLSRALAQHHAADPGGVGIVTTFREQAEATLSALRDTDVNQTVPVGTAHAFQGREFDTVIFDLVEDGRGWISKARVDGDPFTYNGVRLFGVGITRTRHRLYLIADLNRAIRPAKGSTPLGLINRLGSANVEVCRAGTLLGLVERRGYRPASTVEAELDAVLREYIQVTDIHDDFAFDEALERHLKEVRRSLWMWSPWVGRKSARFLPLIDAAVARGVDVKVYIRTERDKILLRDSNRRWVEKLMETGAKVIRAQMEHKKIVVLDEQIVLLGSHNPLSQSGSRDVMITSRGAAFADRLLTELGARDFSRPTVCSKCGRERELWRSADRRKGLPYSWRCYECEVRRAR